jgi:hypothetical protein
MKKLSVKNIVAGIIFLGLLIKAFPLALMVFIVWAIYKKQYFGKKLRIFFSVSLIFVGLIGALIVNLPDETTPAATEQEEPAATEQEAAPAATEQEEPAATPAPKQEEPAPAPKAPINIITTLDEADAIQHIKDNAKADWATDFEEQQFVINEQTKAYNDLKALVIDTDIKEQILDQAHSDWGYDFEETLFIYNEQLKAYNELNK